MLQELQPLKKRSPDFFLRRFVFDMFVLSLESSHVLSLLKEHCAREGAIDK